MVGAESSISKLFFSPYNLRIRLCVLLSFVTSLLLQSTCYHVYKHNILRDFHFKQILFLPCTKSIQKKFIRTSFEALLICVWQHMKGWVSLYWDSEVFDCDYILLSVFLICSSWQQCGYSSSFASAVVSFAYVLCLCLGCT